MRCLLIAGLVAVSCLFFASCAGKPAAQGPQESGGGNQPVAAAKGEQPAAVDGAQPAVATTATIQPADWLAKYQVAWKDSPDRGQNDNPRSVLKLGTRLLSTTERDLLKQLAAQPIDTRLQVLKQLLDEAKTRSDLPIEYAAHAAASGDPTTRQQIISDVIKPFAARTDLNATEKTALCRLALELEAIAEVPELAVPVVEHLLSLRPDKPITEKPQTMPAPEVIMPMLSLSQLLNDFSKQVPESQRYDVLAAVFQVQGIPPPPKTQQPSIIVTSMPDGQPLPSPAEQARYQFQSQFERLTQKLFEDRRPRPKLTPQQIASFKDPATPIPEIAKLRQQLEPGDVLLTPEENRQLGARAIQHAVQPASDTAAVGECMRIVGGFRAPISSSDAVALVEKIGTIPPQEQRTQTMDLRIGLGAVLECMNRADVAPVLIAIVKQAKLQWWTFNPPAYVVATPADAKAVAREMVPLWNEKNPDTLRPLLLLADQTDPVDRDKFHQFLITRIKAWPIEENSKPGYYDRFADQLATAKELSPTTADALLELAFPPEKPQRAGHGAPRKAQGLVLGFASPAVRAKYLTALVKHLEPIEGGFSDGRDYSGQFAIDTFGVVSEKLTPQEAQGVTAAIIQHLPKIPMIAYPALARYVAGRPAAERVALMKVVVAAPEPRRVNSSSFRVDQPAGEMAAALAPAEAAELLQTAFAQPLPDRANHFRQHLLLALARRVAREQQPVLGTILAPRIQQTQQPLDQITLADLALAMPQSLTADQQFQVASALQTTLLTALKPTPDPQSSNAPNAVPPPPPDGLLPRELPLQPAEPKGTPFDQDTIAQERIQKQLSQLVAQLPAERTKPLIQQLLTAADKLNDRIQLNGTGFRQAGSERVAYVLPVFASYPADYAPADLARLTTVYAKFALVDGGREFQQIADGMETVRGTLPAGVGLKLTQDIAQALAARDQGRSVNLKESLAALNFIAAHLAPADGDAAAKLVQALEKPTADPLSMSIPLLPDTIARFAERLSPATANAWIEQYRASGEQNPKQKYAAEIITVAAFRPLAADPAAFVARLQALKLAPQLQMRVLQQLGRGGDPTKLDALLTPGNPHFDPSTPQGLDSVRQVVSEVPITARFTLLEKLAASGKFRPDQLAVLTLGSGRIRSIPDTELKTWLAEPDRVGLRRFAIRSGTFGGSNQPTMWQVLEE